MSIDHFDPVEVPLELHQRLSWVDELNLLAGSLDCFQLTPLLEVLGHLDYIGYPILGSETETKRPSILAVFQVRHQCQLCQFFTRLAAVFAEEVDGFLGPKFVSEKDGPI